MTTPNDPTMSHDSLDAIIAGYMLAVEAGEVPNRQDLLDQHSEHADAFRAFFTDVDRMDRVASPLRLGDGLEATGAAEAMATPRCRPSATSATTSSWRRSPGAGWGSSTRRGRCRSTGSSPSR